MRDILCAGHNHYVHGGSDRYMMELIDLLNAKGNHAIPFAADSDRNEHTEYSKYFPKSVNTGGKSLVDLMNYCYSKPAKKAMQDLLNNQNVDLAHLHIYYGQLTSSILQPLKDRNIPIVQTLHEYKLTCPVYTHLSNESICESCKGKHFHQVIRKKCKENSYIKSSIVALESTISRKNGDAGKIDHFIAPSQFMKRQMLKHDVINEDRISVIPYHIDTDKFSASSRKGDYILYFGRLSAVKGLRTLLLSAKGANFKLKIAGSGPLRSELEETIKRENLHNVELLEFQTTESLQELVAGSICTVLPSEWFDNFPLAIMESMAQARPVVGARIGGISEMISDQIDGLLFEPGNVKQLTEALNTLWNDTQLALEMGSRGREKMYSDFHPDDHFSQINSLYDRLLERG